MDKLGALLRLDCLLHSKDNDQVLLAEQNTSIEGYYFESSTQQHPLDLSLDVLQGLQWVVGGISSFKTLVFTVSATAEDTAPRSLASVGLGIMYSRPHCMVFTPCASITSAALVPWPEQPEPLPQRASSPR